MTTVYVLQHEYEWCGRDEVKFIGVFASSSDADAVIRRLQTQPGFRDWPDGFSIDRHEIGEGAWAEGFSTMVTILVPSKSRPGSYQGATSAWRPGDSYEVCTLDDPGDAAFGIGQVVRCTEQVIEGIGKALVAQEVVRDGV